MYRDAILIARRSIKTVSDQLRIITTTGDNEFAMIEDHFSAKYILPRRSREAFTRKSIVTAACEPSRKQEPRPGFLHRSRNHLALLIAQRFFALSATPASVIMTNTVVLLPRVPRKFPLRGPGLNPFLIPARRR
jgi:hypothetical protein